MSDRPAHSERTYEAQRYRGIIVSTPSRRTRRARPTVAISSGVASYVQLNADQLRWLVEEAGPEALEALHHA